MQKLALKDFELRINPATAHTADDLVQAGAVRNLREVEKNFWVAQVDDERGVAYETEMILSPHKIKAFTCECFTEGRRLMCVHVAATLLKVRNFLEQRTQERHARSEAQAAPVERNRLTVQVALENATPEALALFVREYARRDRDFSLALKTWFAGSVTETENPYALVLDAVLSKNASVKNLREPDFRRLRRTLDDLEIQLQTAVAVANFSVIYQIATAILQKTGAFLAKNEEGRRTVLLQYFQSNLNTLITLSGQPLSPELREAIWDFVLQQGLTALLPLETQRETLRFLSGATTDKVKFARIQQAFDEAPYPATDFVLQLFLTALAVRKMPEATVRVLDDYIEQPAAIKSAILQLYYLKHWTAATLAGEHFFEKNIFNPAQRRELEDVLLYIAENSKDRRRQLLYLRLRFVQTLNFDLYEKIKTVAGEKWPKERTTILRTLEKSGERQKLATVLAMEGEVDELAQLLENETDLRTFQRHENAFFATRKDFVVGRYTTLLTAYLNDHFGPPATVQVRQYLSNLLKKGENDILRQIIRELVALFPDRQSLAEELAEMFPKNRRKAVFLPQ